MNTYVPPRRLPAALAVLAATLLLVAAPPARAQSGRTAADLPTATRAYAIENARIVQAPGRVIERGTVVIRDGLVTAVGRNVAIPVDARRIAGDTLTVYAGFIDGLGHAGVPEPREDDDAPDVDDPGNPPPDVAGIQPAREVTALLDADATSVAALREAGFTAAHVVPREGMLPGKGAVVLLAGSEPQAMVLRDDASLYAQFEGARRIYPSTPMAILAVFRELYRASDETQQAEAAYAADARGLNRPTFNPLHRAFYPVHDGTQPIFFRVEDPLEAHRALALQEELGFPLALAGLARGYDLVDDLRGTDHPLFLSLSLPEEPDSTDADTLGIGISEERAMTPEAPGSFFLSDYRTRSYEDLEGERDALRARRADERTRFLETAARFHEAGLRFGFSTAGVEAKDVRANLRAIVEAGLSEEAALAALTTDAAALLGLESQLGTVEVGKVANLVVTAGSYFDEDAPVRYVFVDGRPHEVEADADRPGDSGDRAR